MIRILAAGIDRTLGISDVRLTLGITKEATTGSFKVDAYGAKWRPAGETEVEVWWDEDGASTKLFGGFIVLVDRSTEQGHVVTYDCTLKNYVHLLDRKNVNRLFEDMSAADVIQEIVDDYAGPGLTTAHVDPDADLTVISVLFNNIPPSQAIQKLADLIGFEWYVDEDKDIHFFAKLSETAPFALSDDAGNHVFESLNVSEDFTQIRNSVLIEGGEELSTVTATDNFIGDGTEHTFTLSRKYSGVVLTVGGIAKTIGIQNIDTFIAKDALYDFNLHTLYFNPSSPPAAGAAIVVTAKYYFPIVVRHREATSLALYGEREHFIQDKSLKSRADAGARALAELAAYARSLRDGGFETYRQGLHPGQKITISSDVDAFTGDFVIQRMSGSLVSPDLMSWRVEVVSVKTFEIIDLLSAIIRNGRIESPANPVVVTAEDVMRRIAVARSVAVTTAWTLAPTVAVKHAVASYIDAPPQWVAGPFAPPSLGDRRRVIFADRGALIT